MLGCIFSKLFRDFLGPCIPTLPIVVLAEFFHVDAVTNVHPLPVSRYLISSLSVYQCSCMHIMSMLWSIINDASSGNCPILFKVLMLNVAICIVRYHFSNFCFSFNSVADFSNTEARRQPFFTCPKIDAVWTGGLSVGHGNLSVALFLFSSILFTNPSARAGYDTRSAFKRSLTVLNSEFSFS